MVDLAQVSLAARALGGANLGLHEGSGTQPCRATDALQRRLDESWRHLLQRAWLAARQAQAGAKLLWRAALRPVALVVAAAALARDLWRHRRRQSWRLLLDLVALDVVLLALKRAAADPVHRLALRGHGHHDTQPGLFHAAQDARLNKILEQLDIPNKHAYTAPRWMLHGDLRTVMPTLAFARREIAYHRFCFPSRAAPSERHGITLDFSFPEKPASAVLLVLAGVGGDSNAPYVRDAVLAAVGRGWCAAVLAARGMGNAVAVDAVENLFDPSDVQDVLEALRLLERLTDGRPVVLAGFSLGGITLCNVLGRHAHELPACVHGAVAVSGGFRCDMLEWDRYVGVYQPLIVPGLLLELHERYLPQLEAALSADELSSLLASRTYRELFDRFFAKMSRRSGRGHTDFAQWKRAQEGAEHRHRIRVPLLFVSACDDPLHSPDTIGAEQFAKDHLYDSPHVAYWLTPSGGHVAWPLEAWPADFRYTSTLAMDFLQASLVHHH